MPKFLQKFFCSIGWHRLEQLGYMLEFGDYVSPMKGRCRWCKRFGLVDSQGNLFQLQTFEIYCPGCKLELESSTAKIYDAGKGEYHYICPKCDLQSNWDFNPPVPILLTTIKK